MAQTSEKPNSRIRKKRSLDLGKTEGNNTDINNTDTHTINLQSSIYKNIAYDALIVQYEKQMIDERLVEFEKRSIVLAYNSGMYKSDQVVILRMPINDETTVKQVDEYFSQLANSFKSQVQTQKKENNDIETDDERT